MQVELLPRFAEDLELGASVSLDGVCLTISEIAGSRVALDLVRSTLERTTLANVNAGDQLNFERSLKVSSEIGGHEVSGHVDTTATVEVVESSPGNVRMEFSLDPYWMRYLFPHGFVSIAGVSLTVGIVDRRACRFDVWLIPETLRRTNLSELRSGMRVNLEVHRGVQVVVDSVTDAVDRFLDRALDSGRLDPQRFAEFVDALQRQRLPGGDAQEPPKHGATE